MPEPRNRYHQRYCGKPGCRRASQRRWECRPENRAYYQGPEKAVKVRAWQAAHPGYRKRRGRKKAVLPEILSAQAAAEQEDATQDGADVLPELWRGQSPMMLVAQMTGGVLPEDIAVVARRLVARGLLATARTP